MAKKTAEDYVKDWNQRCIDWTGLEILCNEESCIKGVVVRLYKTGYPADGNTQNVNSVDSVKTALSAAKIFGKNIALSNRKSNLKNFNENEVNNVRAAAQWVWRTKGRDYVVQNIFRPCANTKIASQKSDNANTSKDSEIVFNSNDQLIRPFDRRLDRLEQSFNSGVQNLKRYVPFSSEFAELSTTGYLISQDSLKAAEKGVKNGATSELSKSVKAEYDKMANDEFYKGVPSLQNYYALVRLYKSDGGNYLVNQKDKRRWYELDSTSLSNYNFASTPTTSALISWGQGDPYGRTPYQFTDFVFSKYWNKIENNRLITLRRFAAPILDNMKFPGMISDSDTGSTTKTEAIAFPPMATAITYFGGESGNTLNSILKFTTGVLWDDAQADVWGVTTDSVPSNESGIGSIFGSIGKFAEMLNVAGGKFDRKLVQNAGQMPPDPYKDGPYENRIMGPINRIDSVKKRKPGLAFEWSGINLVFEYVGRPVGGINPKAVILDIMSNFLVIGSASAVFFGGAHRFMANPAKYPFLGGQEGIEKWYTGDPIGWGLTVVKQFTQGGADPKGGSPKSVASGLFKNMEGFFNQLFSGEKGNIFGAVTSLFTGATGNLINNEMAKKTAGQIPYLQGMKAILTGEPVGEWHVTIGNPLNPIAMIGNLICEGVTVEWNEEMGPDDFPTEIKFTVKLTHAMARDRDAIESIFNRGMGRIYNLPDSFMGSADYQTGVDKATSGTLTNVGYAPNSRMGILMNEETQTGRKMSVKEANGVPLSMGGETSVWSRSVFNLGISENSATQFITNEKDIFKSAFRTADWIAKKSLT